MNTATLKDKRPSPPNIGSALSAFGPLLAMIIFKKRGQVISPGSRGKPNSPRGVPKRERSPFRADSLFFSD